MRYKTIRISSMLLAMALVSLSPRAAETRDPYRFFFTDSFGDFQEELDTAREQGKKAILIFFEMEECPYCQRMKREVLNQPHVQDWFREHFLIFSVDVEGGTEVKDFQGTAMTAKEFAFNVNRVRATPVFGFFDLDGKPIARYTGATRDAREFLWLGEYVADGHYRSTNFTRYKRDKDAAAPTAPKP